MATHASLCAVLAQDAAGRDAYVADRPAYSLTSAQKLLKAKRVLQKMKSRLSLADQDVGARDQNVTRRERQKNTLPDGENLLLQPVLRNNIRPDGYLFSVVRNQKILLSMTDFIDILNIALKIDVDKGAITGWVFKEDRGFTLDMQARRVDVGKLSYTFSDDVVVQDGDIFVPTQELGQWLDIDFDVRISSQEIIIRSKEILPIEARENRLSRKVLKRDLKQPSLPLHHDEYTLASVPAIDVTTNVQFRRRGEGRNSNSYAASVRSVQDFAKGTLNTLTRLDDRDSVSSVRATYSQESTGADLLGALRARRFEVGDIVTTDTLFGGNVRQELGARITNADALRRFTQPLTDITGIGIPGWNVELYRESQLLDFQEIGDDGFYRFSDVGLLLNDNNFRLVFYGPQGERREESIFIPFDNTLLSKGGKGIYDVSVSLNATNLYDARLQTRSDEGALNIAALYERSIARGLSLSLSGDTFENGGERNFIGGVGLSSVIGQYLFNANFGLDDEADFGVSATARRDFSGHAVNATFSMNEAGFDRQTGFFSTATEELEDNTYSADVSLNGPILNNNLWRAQYNLGSNVTWDDDDLFRTISSAGLSAGWRNYNLSTTLRHQRENNFDDFLTVTSSAFGVFGRNRLRLTGAYDIQPESDLRSLQASYNHRLTSKLSYEVDVTRQEFASITEFRSRLDWQAGFIRLSPSVSYNTNDDFFLGLTTRFGLLHEPNQNRVDFYDRNVTSFGMVSAFVYLDANGNGVFDDGDEALPDIKVSAPQNGRSQDTDENGVALFNRMTRLRQTDVFIEKESLPDPTWVSAFEGVSILPRQGYVAQVEFPIHIGGEIDGVVMKKAEILPQSMRAEGYVEPPPRPVRSVTVNLYNEKGEVEQSSVTDSTGFYFFSAVPPGRYLLMVSPRSAELKGFIRPEPQKIEIGYDGTTLYDNQITVLSGEGDVPSAVLAGLSDFKERHPHVDVPVGKHDIVLNLGEYQSRLLMSVVWYKLRSRFSDALQGGVLYVAPKDSYAGLDNGKHVLRVGLDNTSYEDAYNRCRGLIVQDQFCEVEIIPLYSQEEPSPDAPLQKQAQVTAEGEQNAPRL